MTAFLKRLAALARSRKAQLALALRVTVAAVGAFAIASALHLMLPLWAVLTSLIVTQMSVGRSLKATRDYMLGTVGGAIYGGAIAVLIPHSGAVGLLALGAEAERERAAHLSADAETGPLLRTILRLRHDAVMIGRATVVPLPSDLQTRLAMPLAKVSDAIVVYLRSSAGALRTAVGNPAIEPVETALQLYAAEVAALRGEGLTRGLPGDVAERFFALGFS